MLEAKKIGNKIAEARKILGISQAQLAERLFISPQAVGKWERGESLPDITTFNRLADILGVDFNYFSENFPSQNELSATKPGELQSEKPDKKPGWDMSRGNWLDADFSGLENLHEKFSSSNMQRCKFNGSNLSGLQLNANNVDSCDFSDSNISKSIIQRSNLLQNKFKNCLLKETNFSSANLGSCDFSNADLSEAKFSKCNLYGCTFTGTNFTGVVFKSGGFSGVEKAKDLRNNTIDSAVWKRTSFIDSQIADLTFEGKLEGCCFENCKFTRVTFRNATLVDTFFKNNRNLKKVKFIECKADRLTYEFLKQGGVDLSGVNPL